MLVMKFPKSQQDQHQHSEPAPRNIFCSTSKILSARSCVFVIFQVQLWSTILFSVLAGVKTLMFTPGLNKFYCSSLCDRFKIISPTKTRYQTGEKVAQIQGQDDKFSAKSCQISGVGRIYFNWNKTNQVVFGLEKISANLYCSSSLSGPPSW